MRTVQQYAIDEIADMMRYKSVTPFAGDNCHAILVDLIWRAKNVSELFARIATAMEALNSYEPNINATVGEQWNEVLKPLALREDIHAYRRRNSMLDYVVKSKVSS